MKFLWCDTETTGIHTQNAAPFEIALIFVCNTTENSIKIKEEKEKIYFCNPFDIPGMEYSEEAGRIHGYSKEQIMSFRPSSEVVLQINDFLDDCFRYSNPEKMFFCGYNGNFDFEHLISLFNHHNLDFAKYFQKQKLDVFNQVKLAGYMKKLPYLGNRKLTTIAEFLQIKLENAHDAMGDIKATREVAKSLVKMGVPLK